MKQSRIFFLTIFTLLIVYTNSYSQRQGFGIGIIIGEPTGISMKGWLTSKSAIDAGLAWSFIDETSFHIHADYIWHSFDLIKTKEELPVYYGIGGRIKIDDHDTRIGLRMVGGIEYIFKDAPLDIFFEVAPILDLAPATKLSANAGLGARFFFH